MPDNMISHTRIRMGMPVTVKIVGKRLPRHVYDAVFDWFTEVDNRYSPFKSESEVSRVNAGLPKISWSKEFTEVLSLCEETTRSTDGYFNAYRGGALDPSGLVKGWAIQRAAEKIKKMGYADFIIDAGGDIQTFGKNDNGEAWRIGIRNPFNREEIVKVLYVSHNEGVATSGSYIRGDHIYNPLLPGEAVSYFSSVTLIGRNIYDADRFATAVYAMGEKGAEFTERRAGLEGYFVRSDGMALLTSGIGRYLSPGVPSA